MRAEFPAQGHFRKPSLLLWTAITLSLVFVAQQSVASAHNASFRGGGIRWFL